MFEKLIILGVAMIMNGLFLTFFWFVVKNYIAAIERRFDQLIKEIHQLRTVMGTEGKDRARQDERIKTLYKLFSRHESDIDFLKKRIKPDEDGK